MALTLHNPVAQINGMSLYFAGDVAIIVMNRGENRINDELTTGFNELLDRVESHVSCKGLITTGIGKFYSNGLDLNKFATMSQEEVAVTLLRFTKLMNRLILFPIPTMAVLNGHAFAGGALIAFAHDLRTMRTKHGWICLNEVFINLQFGKTNLSLLELKLGKGPNYTDALVLGKRFTAEEALRVGFVHSIQPESLLLNDSLHVLKSFYGKGYSRDSLRLMKQDVYREYIEVYQEDKIEEQIEDTKRGIFPTKSRL